MVGPERGISADAMAHIAYLARSQNRIEILETLATGAHTPRNVEEQTGTSRSTLERITTELDEREWAKRNNHGEYVLTETGERIAEETSRYVGAMEAIETLGEAASWLPSDELTIDLRHFRDATVRRPRPNAAAAPSTYATQLMREATEFACLVNIPPSLGFQEAMINGVTDGRLTTKHVITAEELSVLRQNAERASRWQTYIEAGAELYCYDDRIPCNILVIDEIVLILDRHPEALEGIESTNTAVRSWAHEMVDKYQTAARQLDAGALTHNPTAQIGDNER